MNTFKKFIFFFIFFLLSLQQAHSMQNYQGEDRTLSPQEKAHILVVGKLEDRLKRIKEELNAMEDLDDRKIYINDVFSNILEEIGNKSDPILDLCIIESAKSFKDAMKIKYCSEKQNENNIPKKYINYSDFIQDITKDDVSVWVPDNHRNLINKHFQKTYNPPFYKLKIKNRDVYILGSSHSIPPQALLHTKVFEEVQNLLKHEKPTLFLEHKGFEADDKILELLEKSGKEEDQWVIPKEYEELLNVDMLKYDRERKKVIETNIPLNNVKKLDFKNRIECLSNYVYLKKLHNLGFGFEEELENFKDASSILYLDFADEESHKRLLSNKEYKENYETFQKAGKSEDIENLIIFDIHNKLKNLHEFETKGMDSEYGQKILQDYTTRILRYYWNCELQRQKGDDIIIDLRNHLWVDRVIDYLGNSKENGSILIVCGAAHLSFSLKEENRFLTLLGKHQDPGSILERFSFDNEKWEWIPIKPQEY